MSTENDYVPAPTARISGCIQLDGRALNYVPLGVETPGQAVTADVTGDGIAPTLGAGIARFEDIDFEWEHPCDEAVYVISGDLYVTSVTGTVVGQPGDVLFMSQGAQLRYRTTGECTVFASMNLTPAHVSGVGHE